MNHGRRVGFGLLIVTTLAFGCGRESSVLPKLIEQSGTAADGDLSFTVDYVGSATGDVSEVVVDLTVSNRGKETEDFNAADQFVLVDGESVQGESMTLLPPSILLPDAFGEGRQDTVEIEPGGSVHVYLSFEVANPGAADRVVLHAYDGSRGVAVEA